MLIHDHTTIIYSILGSEQFCCASLPIVCYCRYTWTKNGIVLNLDQPNIRCLSYGGIAIVNASSSDQGYYQCHANNAYGSTMSITYVLTLAFLDYDPPCWDYQEHSGDAGKPVRDDGNSVDSLKSFPAVNYGWEMLRDKNDSSPVPVQPSNRIQIDHLGMYIQYGILYIINPRTHRGYHPMAFFSCNFFDDWCPKVDFYLGRLRVKYH